MAVIIDSFSTEQFEHNALIRTNLLYGKLSCSKLLKSKHPKTATANREQFLLKIAFSKTRRPLSSL